MEQTTNNGFLMLAHEVGHLPQAAQSQSLFKYLNIFIKQYKEYGHDKAPFEREANTRKKYYTKFIYFIDTYIAKDALFDLFKSKLNESDKIERLDIWNKYFLKYLEIYFIGPENKTITKDEIFK